MRLPTLLIAPAVSAISSACASAPVQRQPAADCPNRVLATVTNTRRVPYDVYYMAPGGPARIIGDVIPGATASFPIPGTGNGYVYVRRPASDTQSENVGNPTRPLAEIRIRLHCSGT